MAKPKKLFDPFIDITLEGNDISVDTSFDDEDEVVWSDVVEVTKKPATVEEESDFGIDINFDAIINPEFIQPKQRQVTPSMDTGEEKPKRKRSIKDANVDGGESPENVRESADFYEKRFQDSIVVIDGMIDEIDMFKAETKQDLDVIKQSKQRGVLTHISNQTSNITQLLGMKLNAIKEKNSVIKNISDLEIKRTTKDGANGKDDNKIIDSIFSRMMNANTAFEHNAIDQMSQALSYDAQVDNLLSQRTDRLINNGEMELNSSDIAVMYESVGAQIVILRDPMSNDWRFMAVDGDYNEIRNYPLPSGDLSIKFLANNKAKDQYNRQYEVIDIPR